MPVARIVKRPSEAKNYTLDYSSWLETGDQITSVSTTVSPVTIPALSATAAPATGFTSVVMAVSGGVASTFYQITVQIYVDTAPEQIKEDCVEVGVEEYC